MQFRDLTVYSQMNAQTIALYIVSNAPESNSGLHRHSDLDDVDRQF